eukprot:EG_transcript_5593
MDEKTSLLETEVAEVRRAMHPTRLLLTLASIFGALCFFAGIVIERNVTFPTHRGPPPAAGLRPVQDDPRAAFLIRNANPSGLPLSYFVEPEDIFERLPESFKPHGTDGGHAPECDGKWATKEQWDAYNFQTEQLLVTHSCNIYDAAVGSIALAITGHTDESMRFFWEFLDVGRTARVDNIRGNAPCRGREAYGECKEPPCGLCYGDDPETMTVQGRHAWFYRLLSDDWQYNGHVNQLCPELKRPWTWVDYKPVLGDNAWATLLGPLHVLWLRNGGNGAQISPNAPELRIALDFFGSLHSMLAGDTGGVYFCPRNTYFAWLRVSIGSQVSTENVASLLGGLKALRYLLLRMDRPTLYKGTVKELDSLIEGLHKFLRSAFDPQAGYFRTGGMYNAISKKFDWTPADGNFAVDCQSWVATALGSDLIDQWFGAGTTLRLWEKTRDLAGYERQPSGMVKGVGYTLNAEAQVCSGEWSFGVANWLRTMATESAYDAATKAKLNAEAKFIADHLKKELTHTVEIQGQKVQGILYASKSYHIPPHLGGWSAFPIPSRASTAWGLFWDNAYNPFHLLGNYSSRYDL